MKKLITEVSNEDLLKILNDTQEVEILPTATHDVYDFITTIQLKSGKEPITTALLYKIYNMWSKNPVGMIKFSLILKELFPNKKHHELNMIYTNLNKNKLLKQTIEYYRKDTKLQKKSSNNRFNEFMKYYGLKPGRFCVRAKTIQDLYRNHTNSYMGMANIVAFCKLYFKYFIINDAYWFKVDSSIIKHLTPKMLKELKGRKKKLSKYEKETK